MKGFKEFLGEEDGVAIIEIVLILTVFGWCIWLGSV